MNLKEFLEQNKIIKESHLATLMWPDKKHAAAVFSNKMKEVPNIKTQSKQRIIQADEDRAKVVLLKLSERIIEYASDVEIIEPTAPKQAAPIKEKEPAPIKKTVVKKVKEPTVKKEVPKRNLFKELEDLRNQEK